MRYILVEVALFESSPLETMLLWKGLSRCFGRYLRFIEKIFDFSPQEIEIISVLVRSGQGFLDVLIQQCRKIDRRSL